MNEAFTYKSNMNVSKTVHIADSDPEVCERLGVLFRTDGFKVVISTTADVFMDSLEKRRPDVAVIDLDFTERGGFLALCQMKHLHRATPAIMLTGACDTNSTVRAMRMGADTVIPKPLDNERVLESVRDALRVDLHMGEYVGGARTVEIRGFGTLTSRERQVLQLFVDGNSNKEAALTLNISGRTVEVHRARIMKKLGAKNSVDLMRRVLSR